MKRLGRLPLKIAALTMLMIATGTMLWSHHALAAGRDGVYFKVYNSADLTPDANNGVTVTCNTYDNHLMFYDDEGPIEYPITQSDPILAVSALCPKDEMHLDPVVHIDGNENDTYELKDAQDGYIDFNSAYVVCIENDPGLPLDNPTGLTPVRVILQCLDHDALIADKKGGRQP